MGKIYVIYGHSGSGKTTLADNLKKEGIGWIKTATTRPKRGDNDKGYYFWTLSEFERLLDNGDVFGVRDYITLQPDEDGGYKHVLYRYGFLKDVINAYSDRDSVIITDLTGLYELTEMYGPERVVGVYLSGTKEQLKERAMKRDDFNETEWERRYKKDNATLSQKEFDRHAFGDKALTGHKFFSIDIALSPQEQVDYFLEIIRYG